MCLIFDIQYLCALKVFALYKSGYMQPLLYFVCPTTLKKYTLYYIFLAIVVEPYIKDFCF